MTTSKGFVRALPVTVQLTTGSTPSTSVTNDSGVVTRGIWNGERLLPCYIPSASKIPGAGSVTSVAATVPAEFSVAGSPITTAGTLAITKATQTANKVWASATSGGAAQPAFRALVAADLPAGTGTVTSVGLTAPAMFSVSGSPVTTTGSLAFALATQTANTLFAGPTTGAASAPTFRALVANDIPSTLNASTFTTSITTDTVFLTVAGAGPRQSMGALSNNTVTQFRAGGAISTSSLSDGKVEYSHYVDSRGSSNFGSAGFQHYSNCWIVCTAATSTMTLPAPVGGGRTLGFQVGSGAAGTTLTIASASGSQIYDPFAGTAFALTANMQQLAAKQGSSIFFADLDGTGWIVVHSTGTWI